MPVRRHAVPPTRSRADIVGRITLSPGPTPKAMQGQLQRHRSRTHRHAAVHTDIGGHTSFELRHHRTWVTWPDCSTSVTARTSWPREGLGCGIIVMVSEVNFTNRHRVDDAHWREILRKASHKTTPVRHNATLRLLAAFHLCQNDGDRQLRDRCRLRHSACRPEQRMIQRLNGQ